MREDSIKVLIVDDDEDDYVVTRDLLDDVERQDYEVRWTYSYAEAIEIISGSAFDVFIFDYHLGASSGLDLVQEVRSSGNTTPIILLTGQQESEIDIEAIKAGASDYLSKGEINSQLLERAIRYALERKRTEERILRMAYYDGLTGLPNRTLFNDRLAQAIAHTIRYDRIGALMFIDLDNFKRINDTLEHRIGDLLLMDVARRLQNYIRSSDSIARHSSPVANTVARLGGDEFTILLTDLGSLQDAAGVAHRILSILSRPFSLEGHEVFVGASIGISVFPADGEDADTVTKNADTAMYHTKADGRNNFQFYKQSMNSTAMERLNMENNLRRAMEREELILYYQPRFNARTGMVAGTEALIRWAHPESGIIAPGQFIPIAEESGLIIPIGEWVMKTACMQKTLWHREMQTQQNQAMSINLSGRQLQQKDLIKVVEKVLDDSGLPPECLEIEITESVIMHDAALTIKTLGRLKDMGVSLSMDDFGTGYSSFSYLKKFPLDIIKIDRSFIQDMTNRIEDAAIVKAIIVMAHTLRLQVVAEGVETEEQLSMLKDMDCDEVQGFLLARPLPEVEAIRFLSSHPTENAAQNAFCKKEP